MVIGTAREAARLLVPLFSGCEGEKIVAAHLDADQRLIQTIEGKNGAMARWSCRSARSSKMRSGWLGPFDRGHNHPSGDPRPSQADFAATRELAATAESLGIQLHDPLIVGENGDCRSFRALGLL